MAKVEVTKSINVPASEAWAKISAFKGIEDFSPIARSVMEGEGPGAKRTCYMPDGAEIYEKLNIQDNDNMHFQYEITEGPFPITGYVSDVYVKSLGENECEVTWKCTYNVGEEAAEEMEKLFGGFYNVMISNLEKLIQGQEVA